MKFDTKHCIICKKPRKTVYFNISNEGQKNEKVWIYCCACGRSYSSKEYCELGGITEKELFSNHIDFNETKNNEVNRLDWPTHFVSMLDRRATPGVEYLESRGLIVEGDIYYDTMKKGIVFPMYYDQYFCGAQIRLIHPREDSQGKITKMVSETGTRTSILMYNWNQFPFLTDVKAVVLTEGAINCLSLMQAMTEAYKDKILNPYKFISLSGSG